MILSFHQLINLLVHFPQSNSKVNYERTKIGHFFIKQPNKRKALTETKTKYLIIKFFA